MRKSFFPPQFSPSLKKPTSFIVQGWMLVNGKREDNWINFLWLFRVKSHNEMSARQSSSFTVLWEKKKLLIWRLFFYHFFFYFFSLWKHKYKKTKTFACQTTNNNRFPNSKQEEWEKIFPSFTTKEEIGLVDGLVKYNPKQRLSATEVSAVEGGKFSIRMKTLPEIRINAFNLI